MHFRIAIIGSVVLAAVSAAAAATPRAARFADGTLVTEGDFKGWHTAPGQPTFADRPLFDPANPVRWVVSLPEAAAAAGPPPRPPTSFIEFAGGDRLPGVVEAYRSGRETFGDVLPPHLVVRPLVPVGPAEARVRVRADAVRRIVNGAAPAADDPDEPRAVALADGRRVPFRAHRWSDDGFLLLTAEGATRLPFADVAAFAPDARDPWDACFDALALLAPDGFERLVRCETAAGLVATTSFARFRAGGSENDPGSWQHVIQPAWSLDPIAVRHADVTARWFFAPHEVPLPLVPLGRADQRPVFGGAWRWQAGRNVQGGPLVAGGTPAGWGYGVQATSDLFFPLPAIATGFRCGVALDEIARGGGCAIGRVCLDSPTAKPLWQSGMLVGTAPPADTGILSFAAKPDGSSHLVLAADDAHKGRPAGADPFDIRDLVDWFDPLILLDAAKLADTIRERLPRTILAWEGWAVAVDPGAALVVRDVAEGGGWTRAAAASQGPLLLERTVEVGPDVRFVVVGVSRFAAAASRIEVRVDGETIAAADVPERAVGWRPRPFLVPLDRFAGRTVKLTVAHLPADPTGLVTWHCLETAGPLESRWQAPEIVAATAAGGATFKPLDDGSLLVEGPSPDHDVFTLRIRPGLPTVTGVRLETFKHESLPAGGPGRGDTGNYVLSSIGVAAVDPAAAAGHRPAEITRVDVTLNQDGFREQDVIQGAGNGGWAGGWKPGTLVVAFARPLACPPGGELVVTLGFATVHSRHSIGRLGLAATGSPVPAVVLPGVLLPDTGGPAPPQPPSQ